jgi:5-formyltetrahydrofolate cyclo-ligase
MSSFHRLLFMSPSDSSRSRLRRQRRRLCAQERRLAARRAAAVAASLAAFRYGERIAFYLASDGELDPMPLMQRAVEMGKQCYLPVLHPLYKRLWFARWQPGDPLQANCYGIPEPVWSRTSLIDSRALTLLIMPLVAFDARCNRMGMGAGYYDRTLAWRLLRRHWKGPTLVGYAYVQQQLPSLQTQPWDVPMDMVITEQAILRCRQ